jgi:small conductance mechanosensitive channel
MILGQFTQSWDILREDLVGWYETLVGLIPNIVLAIVLLIVIMISARFVKLWTLKLFDRFSKNHAVNKLLSSLSTGIFILFGLFVILSVLNLDKTVTSLLAGAGIVGLALGLAFQEPIINTISGILMSVRELYNLNDLVITNDYLGKIDKINLRTTTLRKLSGELVTIPNKLVIQNPLENLTISGERRVEFSCGISYGEDLAKVKSVALEAVAGAVETMDGKEIEFFYTGYGDSSIDFIIRFWIDLCSQKDYYAARSEAIMALKAAFDENDITIPFPIRTLDFGIKGGRSLSNEMSFSENGDGMNVKKQRR